MPQYPACLHILLLSESETASSLDRRALRDAGFANASVMTSGIDAARYLAGLYAGEQSAKPCVVICSRELEDMDGEQFCAIIRQHPLLQDLPILLLLPNDTEAEQLKALGCGASSLMGRPYSLGKLRMEILKLADAAKNAAKPAYAKNGIDTSAFDSALATYGILLRPTKQPEDFFRIGMKCLAEKQWNTAIGAFQTALQDADLKAKAEMGIAAAYKGKGDMAAFAAWLGRATETLVAARRWKLARSSFARLLEHDPQAKNPFLAEAHRLIRQKEYQQASEALVQCVNVIPKSRTGAKFASACMSADDPRAMFRALSSCLAREDPGNDYLNAEIRQNLEILTRERRDREKMREVERKWQISRQMAEKKNAASAQAPAKKESAVASLGDNDGSMDIEAGQDAIPADDKLENFDENHAPDEILPPLGGGENVSSSGKPPKLNDFLSVVKLTWDLARKSRKK